jgi:transcriptional regulator with XRE-family HTH domain
MLIGIQIRAARALLAWDQATLAKKSGISLPTIKRLETGPGELHAHMRSITKIKSALEAAGIVFIDEGEAGGCGVRLGRRQRKSR